MIAWISNNNGLVSLACHRVRMDRAMGHKQKSQNKVGTRHFSLFSLSSEQHAWISEKLTSLQLLLLFKQQPHLPVRHAFARELVKLLARPLERHSIVLALGPRQSPQQSTPTRGTEVGANVLVLVNVLFKRNPVPASSTQMGQNGMQDMVPSRVLQDILAQRLGDDGVLVQSVRLAELVDHTEQFRQLD